MVITVITFYFLFHRSLKLLFIYTFKKFLYVSFQNNQLFIPEYKVCMYVCVFARACVCVCKRDTYAFATDLILSYPGP